MPTAVWDWLLRTPFTHDMTALDAAVLGGVQGALAGAVLLAVAFCLRLIK